MSQIFLKSKINLHSYSCETTNEFLISYVYRGDVL